MKIIGILLILGALIGGGLILSDTVPGYFRNKDHLAHARTELAKEKTKLETLGAGATEAEIDRTIRSSQTAIDGVRYAEEGVARRRNESLIFAGGTLAVLALGTFLFMRGRKKKTAQPQPAIATAANMAPADYGFLAQPPRGPNDQPRA